MTLQEFAVKLGLDLDAQSFAKGELAVKALEKGLEVFRDVVTEAAKALPEMVAHVAEVGHEVELTATKTGLTTDAVQELGYVAGTVGVGSEELSHGLAHLSRSMVEARTGGKEASDAFHVLGQVLGHNIDLNRPVADVFDDVANAFSKMKADDPKRIAVSMQLFSRAGMELLPVLSMGASGIHKLGDEAHELGMVLDEATVSQAGEYQQSVKKIHAAWEGFKLTVGSTLLPLFKELAENVFGWVKANRALIAQNLKQVFGAVVSVLRAAGPVLKGIWQVMMMLVAVVKLVADNWKFFAVALGSYVITAVTATILGMQALGGASIIAAAETAAAWIAAAAPIVALAALIAFVVLIAEDLYTGLTGGESFIFEAFDALDAKFSKWTSYNDSDPWFIKALKGFLVLIKITMEQMEFWGSVVMKIIDGVKAGLDGLVAGFKFIGKALDAVSPDWERLNKSLDAHRDVGPSAGRGDFTIPPNAMSPSSVVTLKVDSINIQTQPGDDAVAIGGHVQKALDEYTRRLLREAHAGVRQ